MSNCADCLSEMRDSGAMCDYHDTIAACEADCDTLELEAWHWEATADWLLELWEDLDDSEIIHADEAFPVLSTHRLSLSLYAFQDEYGVIRVQYLNQVGIVLDTTRELKEAAWEAHEGSLPTPYEPCAYERENAAW